jgi:fructose-bisphosphate aldolase class I
VYSIGAGRPSEDCVRANAHALGRYAALCQEAGLVPIVEPEVLMDGTHQIEESADATARVLAAVYDELYAQRVDLRATLLKPNMVLSGYSAPEQATAAQAAEATLDVLCRHVPAAVPGIVFLSGGQSDEDATAHLNALNALGPHPWQLSFSFGRALQSPALHAWSGRDQNRAAAQQALHHRAKMNSAARSGNFTAAMESESAAA